MISIWEQETCLADVDYLVIGAGITGLNAAIHLKELHPGKRVMVVDQHSWGGGASYRNAGFACLGSPTELLDDLANRDSNEVWEVVEMRWKGLQRLKQKIGSSALQLEWCGGMEIFPQEESASLNTVGQQLEELNAAFKDILGQDHHFSISTPEKSAFKDLAGVVHIKQEGRLHPGFMMNALQKMAIDHGVEVHRGISIQRIQPGQGINLVETTNGPIIRAAMVGIATNGFTSQWYPSLPVTPARNQVFLTEPVPMLDWDSCLHFQRGYVYARRHGDRILIGGARHLDLHGETTTEEGTTPEIEAYLHSFIHRHFPLHGPVRFDHSWSGVLGIGQAKKPLIQAIDQNVFAAVRLGGMGVAIGTLVGESLAEMMSA